MKVYDHVLQVVGNTPLVRLDRVTRGINATVLVKCEQLNPGGSIKDRIALHMINKAEEEGQQQNSEHRDGRTQVRVGPVQPVAEIRQPLRRKTD